MIYSGKSFQRRPWERGDNGLVRHFDGIQVRDLSPPAASRGFYFCLHTASQQLLDNHIVCDSPNGWIWPALYLENFVVESTRDVTGVYLMDGMIPGIRFEVHICNGKFIDMVGKAPLISINYINLSDLILTRLKVENCESSRVEISNCTVGCLRVFYCDNLHFELNNTQIRQVELCGCKGITFSGTTPKVIELPSTAQGVVGSLSVIVSVGGKLYRGDASNILFRDYHKP